MTCYLARLLSYRCRLSGAMTTDPGDRSGSGMAQHEPLARVGALYRNEWPGSATTGLMQCSKESSNFDDEALTRNLPPGC